MVGWVTSGGYAHTVDRAVALGYVPYELADPPKRFETEILASRCRAAVRITPMFDPD